MSVWRVGYFESPCEFTPRDLCDWNHRFDDPLREYRTVYAADKKETCLREVLADLRPNKKTLADFKKFFGDDEAAESAGVVAGAWRARNVLARADIEIESGEMANIESAAILTELTERLARQLESRGIKRLDAARVRSKDRDLTRAASRLLHEDGHCGIDFRSCLDAARCHALFEGRARLRQIGDAIDLTRPVPELVSVCGEYGLTLR